MAKAWMYITFWCTCAWLTGQVHSQVEVWIKKISSINTTKDQIYNQTVVYICKAHLVEAKRMLSVPNYFPKWSMLHLTCVCMYPDCDSSTNLTQTTV